MNILPMKYFVKVVKKEGISAAAKELYITQQTLSAHMAALEKELECCLFVRKPRFVLTPEGEVFYEYCKKFISLDEAMHQQFQEMKHQPSGTIRVAISQTRSSIMMPTIAMLWRQYYPGMMLHIVEATNNQLLNMVLENQADIMIGNIHEEVPELKKVHLYDESLNILVPKTQQYADLIHLESSELSVEKLLPYAFVMNTKNDIVGRYGNIFFEKNNFVPKIAAISDNAETCIEMCIKGMGLYLCPSIFLKNKPQLLETLHCCPLNIQYSISAAYHKSIYNSHMITKFINTVQKVTRKFSDGKEF